jgi:hypothetical protein
MKRTTLDLETDARTINRIARHTLMVRLILLASDRQLVCISQLLYRRLIESAHARTRFHRCKGNCLRRNSGTIMTHLAAVGMAT